MGYGINKFVYGNYIDEVLAMFSATAVYFPAQDYLYSTVALFDAAGNVVERYEYDAYGKVQILTPNYELRTASLYGNPYTFTGRRLDVLDTGSLKLMYYRARTYDPQTGRFMQRDPLGINPVYLFRPESQFNDGTNFYEYVKSNSVVKKDAFGLDSTPAENENYACCKVTKTNLIWDGVSIPMIRETCYQTTIDSKGSSPMYACKCHYKGQKNIKIYGAHRGKCCRCYLYYYSYPGGVLGMPSQAHAALNVICEQGRESWSAEVWPESTEGATPFKPHYVHPQVNAGGLSGDAADGQYGQILGAVSCDVADEWKKHIVSIDWLYQFPLSDCRDFVRRIAKTMNGMCP
jgi:RHS repeat-associated protein